SFMYWTAGMLAAQSSKTGMPRISSHRMRRFMNAPRSLDRVASEPRTERSGVSGLTRIRLLRCAPCAARQSKVLCGAAIIVKAPGCRIHADRSAALGRGGVQAFFHVDAGRLGAKIAERLAHRVAGALVQAERVGLHDAGFQAKYQKSNGQPRRFEFRQEGARRALAAVLRANKHARTLPVF